MPIDSEPVAQSNLWQDPFWLKLLHYQGNLQNTKFVSDISSKEFFLSSKGRIDPKAELEATIAAFAAKPSSDPDAHAQCRFVARLQWLKERLPASELAFSKVACPKFLEWSRQGKVDSISLMFITGYFSNPASFFGHPMIRFNVKEQGEFNYLLDTGINYGAFTPEDPNPFAYIFKGLLGGYNAGYTSSPFFYSNHNYTEVELRDIWEYKLKLTDAQRDILIAHTWELMNMNFPYYFLSDNCASRVAELIEAVTGKKVNTGNPLYNIPHNLYDRIFELGLVSEINKIESRQSRFTARFTSLPKPQQEMVAQSLKSSAVLDSKEYLVLNDMDKSRVLETLINYYSYRIILEATPELEAKRKDLLFRRSQLPPLDTTWKQLETSPPHLGQNPTSSSIGFFYDKKVHTGFSLRMRAAYYDFLSPNAGRHPDSELIVADLRVNATKEKIWLEKLEIFSVISLNLSKTSLPEDGGLAWDMRLGLIERDYKCFGCLALRFESGLGKAWRLLDGATLYGFADAWVQTNGTYHENYAIAPRVGMLINVWDVWRANLSFGKRYFLDKPEIKPTIYRIENRLGNSKNWDLSFSYANDRTERYSLAISKFW